MLAKGERLVSGGFANLSRAVSFTYGSFRFSTQTPAAAAVVISKKTLPSSVERHRAKRRVTALLRVLVRSGMLKKSVVVYPNARALSAPHADLKESLRRALISG